MKNTEYSRHLKMAGESTNQNMTIMTKMMTRVQIDQHYKLKEVSNVSSEKFKLIA